MWKTFQNQLLKKKQKRISILLKIDFVEKEKQKTIDEKQKQSTKNEKQLTKNKIRRRCWRRKLTKENNCDKNWSLI